MSVRNLVGLIYSFAGEIRNGRTPDDVLRHADSEVIELREEVTKVAAGQDEGADGVVGEAIDIIACVVDLLHEVGTPLDDAVKEIDNILDTLPRTRLDTLPGFIQAIEGDLDAVRQAVSVRYMVVPRSAFLVRTLILMIRHHSPNTKLDQIEAIALKKCEKWKLHYSKSVERVR